ncbi:multicilin [Cololabis saira]|uniref:multicilin n=1 Tax=Cololabis saira TaxID=129043 RepID=UPI002AD4E5C9|nr:multicilin [Cololabis saira]
MSIQFCRQNRWRRKETEERRVDKILVPRSSSPVTVYVELPCVLDQEFSTIAWDDLEDCTFAVTQERNSLDSQNGSDPGHFGDYVLDFMAESAATLESSLSSAELVQFQGCVIPPLTPQGDFAPEDSLVHTSTETDSLQGHDGELWRSMAECHERELGHAGAINKQLHETFHRQQEELDSLQERNLHLRQLASRAKHLASALEKLMTVGDQHVGEPVVQSVDNGSLGPCKRQRLDEGYETESSDSVEDLLKDISTRCNAVLHSNAGLGQHGETETIRMYGAFSGLQMSTLNDGRTSVDGPDAGDSVSSFRTTIREHGTIRTQVFPHGHAFTSRTQQGGYRFRWLPNHN